MNEYDAIRLNGESSLKIYRESREILKARIDGEDNVHIRLNGQCTLDGLSKMIMLKEQESNQYIRMKNSEETE